MSVRQHPPDVAYQLINDSIQREPVPMRAFHCKTRLISFRLSDDEYECLHSLCSACGARSISDFLRATVRSLITINSPSVRGFAAEPTSAMFLGGLPHPRLLNTTDHSTSAVQALTEMVLTLHRKTDSLARSVNQLRVLIQPAPGEQADAHAGSQKTEDNQNGASPTPPHILREPEHS